VVGDIARLILLCGFFITIRKHYKERFKVGCHLDLDIAVKSDQNGRKWHKVVKSGVK
jgi:hypothetical protein